MITNKGQAILSKYLIGQTPAYASYIAIGCGAAPLLPSAVITSGDYDTKTSMDFEIARFPVTSRGYVTEVVEGTPVKQLVLTAQIPAANRYGITEVGIYPAESNPVSNNNDSKVLLSFGIDEQWQIQTGSAVPSKNIAQTDSVITETSIMFANALDAVMLNSTRQQANEIPRNSSYSVLFPADSTDHLVLNNPNISLQSSAPTDKLKLAFSVFARDLTSIPLSSSNATISLTFYTNAGGTATADFVKEINTSSTSRYYVAEVNVENFVISGTFSWADVSRLEIDLSLDSNSDEYLLALDGLRLENYNSISPIYGLVGYTVIKNSTTTSGGTPGAVPIIKEKDKTALVEFRFRVEVL